MLRCQWHQTLTVLKEGKMESAKKRHREQGLHFLGNNTFRLLFLHQLATAKGALLCILGPTEQDLWGASAP